MSSVILIGAVNTNTPQQNAGVFLGEFNFSGWDANIKLNQAHGGLYGFFNIIPVQYNLNLDNMEIIDGVINDQDIKPLAGSNI